MVQSRQAGMHRREQDQEDGKGQEHHEEGGPELVVEESSAHLLPGFRIAKRTGGRRHGQQENPSDHPRKTCPSASEGWKAVIHE